MNNTLEKEVRGPLYKDMVEKINVYAEKNNWEVNRYKQISIYCNTDDIEKIGTVTEGKGRIIIDIRKSTITVKVKIGNALSFERKEYKIKSDVESCQGIAVLFSLLGIEEGFVRTFDRTDFKTKNGIKFTIKLNCLMGDHFELERNSDDECIVDSYNKIIDDLELRVWTKEELAQAIQNDHNKVEAKNIRLALKELL